MVASTLPSLTPLRRPPSEVGEIVAAVTAALHEAAAIETLEIDDVARWCAAFGGVDPRLERAALLHAFALVSLDVLVADLAATLRARLLAAGPHLTSLIASGGVPLVLASLGLDDVEPPAEAMQRPVPARIARFYWQRLRAFVAWSTSCAWS
jgi:hypothetical protein